MRCDSCGDDDAVVHWTQIVDNEMTTRHLCAACAAEQGVEPAVEVASAPLTDFLAQMGKSLPAEGTAGTTPCPGCGLSVAELRRTGRLGCAVCYTHFAPQLRGLLRRLHGGTQHVGKAVLPTRSPAADRAARVLHLRRSLQHAVEAEDFERAAQLRDQIRRAEAAEAGRGEER